MSHTEYYGVAPGDKKEVALRARYVATAGQTTFAANYSIGTEEVYKNGRLLDWAGEYSAPNGTEIVLATPASAGDVILIISRRQVETSTMVGQAFTWYTTTATYNNPTITTNYTPGAVFVILNGAFLSLADFSATDGTSVTVPSAIIGNVIDVISFNLVEPA